MVFFDMIFVFISVNEHKLQECYLAAYKI